MQVAVIGGGITGLAAAWHLQQADVPLEIALLEKSPRLGGCIHTERIQGYIVEHGPDVFLARKPEASALCGKLGLPTEQTSRRNRGAFIRRGQVLHGLPEGLTGLVPTRLGPLMSSDLLSIRGRLRVLLDLILPARKDMSDESVTSFFTRRLGREAFVRLIEPVLGGITGGQADKLSMAALLPQLRATEQRHGSVLMGLSAGAAQRQDGTAMRSVPGGLSELVHALKRQLGSVARCRMDVERISRKSNMWQIHIAGQKAIVAEAVILAVPAWSAGAVLKALDPSLAEELDAIPHSSTVAVNVAFPKSQIRHPLNGHGYLVSRKEYSDIAACTWSSSKLPGRAPENYVLLRLFLAGKQAVVLSDDAVRSAVMEELTFSLGVTGTPLFMRIKRYAKAMPLYVLGHIDRIDRICKCLAQHGGLYIAGPMIDGVGIPDCIRSGTGAARNALHHLRTSQTG